MCHSHYDVSRLRRARGARSPRSHYDAILIVTSFAIELAMPTVRDVTVEDRISGQMMDDK